jgi:DNA (cytosine-5)-methyltransferase 1
LAELGYGFSYRVLDAKHFGVPQRRRRVFVVGHLGDWRPSAKVLFESGGVFGDIKKSRKAREDITSFTPSSFGNYGEGVGTLRQAGGDLGGGSETLVTTNRLVAFGEYSTDGTASTLKARDYKDHTDLVVYETHPADSRVKEMGETCQTVTSRWGTGGGNVPLVQAYSIREDAKANNFSATPLDVTPALQALRPSVQSHHAQTFIANPYAVRRLTPIECERLQGFPDNHTNIPWRGKNEAPDSPRYKSLGNSMAVPVMAWLGKRIQMMEEGLL